MRTSRKLTRSVAAAALVLPLGLTAVAAPAGAATAQLVDSYGYPPGYGDGYGYDYGYCCELQLNELSAIS